MGLAAALGIVKGHHGAIRVSSVLGRGTTFKVTFPAAQSEEALPPVSAEAPQDLYGSGLVLVVDEETVRTLAATALRRYRYGAVTAPNGEVALQLVRTRGLEFSLVILDLMMPVMSGEQALAAIKAIHPELPVVLSSGFDELQAVKELDRSLIAGFVQKPYNVRALLEAVKAAAAKKRSGGAA